MAKNTKVLPLTDKKIEALPCAPAGAAALTYAHPRIDGLVLRAWESGAKTWSLIYMVRVDGMRTFRRLTLPGKFPGLSLEKAETAAKVWIGKIALGEDPAADKRDARRVVSRARVGGFGDIARDFLASTAFADMRPVTRAAWRSMIENDILAAWGNSTPVPEEMGRKILEKWFANLMKTRSGHVANRRFEVMRRIFTWAIRADLIEWTPFVKMDAPYSEKPRLRVYTVTEIKAILAAVAKEPMAFQMFWKLTFFTLARRDEVKYMRWAGIDESDQTWSFLGKGKGDGKPHTLPLVTQAIKMLAAGRAFNGDSDYVLAGSNPKRPIQNVQKSVYRIKKFPGVPQDFRVHDVRKTGANRLVRHGFATTEIIGKILNHGSATVTDTYTQYGHVPEMRAALQKYADWLDGVAKGKHAKVDDKAPLQFPAAVR